MLSESIPRPIEQDKNNQVPNFEGALHHMAYPGVDLVPQQLLKRIFGISRAEGINDDQAAQRIAEVMNQAVARVHGVRGKIYAENILGRLNQTLDA